ncbi:MAG: hypothetical protein JO222_09165 [Frankiales bacterium]|nr:hypothetical protein [Frankiales bacterium]
MPREVVALVSADDVVAAVRVHADRVHDLLRRSGCGAAESVEVCESYAFALIDALVNAPETVGDMAGWWFGRALELGRRLGGSAEPADVPASVLSGTSGEAQVRAALATLPDPERAAVMLRDGYDLPPEAVAVALGRSVDGAANLVASGRLRLQAAYDDRHPADLAGHVGRTPADIGTLGRLADGSLPPPKVPPLRRHVSSCHACEEVVEAQAKGRRLAAGLPVIAMPDDAREAMIDRVEERAAAVLPSVDEVLLAVEEEHDVQPAISPVAVIIAVVLALLLGIGVAAIAHNGVGGQATTFESPPPLPSGSAAFPVTPTPHRHRHSPKPSISASPSASRTPSATRSASASATPTPTRPAVPASIHLSPTRGPRGTVITVTGAGWTPGASISVTYRGSLTSSRSSAVAGADGTFSTQVNASGALPGTYTVTATGGGKSSSATFRQTT